MAFGLVAFLIFLSIGASNAVSPMYVVYQARYHFTALTLTEVYAVYAAGVMVALLAVGHLSDVIGRRRVLAPALVLLGLSAVLFAAARGTGWLFAARSSVISRRPVSLGRPTSACSPTRP